MARTKAVLIVGGSGFVGTHLALALRDTYKVYATYNRHPIQIPGVGCFPFHVADRNWAKRLVYNIQPEIVIYSAGSDDAEIVENDERTGDAVHTRGCGGVVGVTDIFQPKFILLSSSYVFDGSKGNYKEGDTLLPRTSLGKYKVAAENYLKGHSLNHVIIRSSPVFGRGNGKNLTFLDHLRLNLSRGSPMKVRDDETHSFGTIEGLVELIVRCMETGVKNKVLHYGGLTKLTQYEFAQEFARRFSYDEKLILPAEPGKTNKDGLALDYSLNSTQAIKQLKVEPLLLEQGFDLLEKKLIA